MAPDITIHFAECCCPIPGDTVIGVLNKTKGIVVHTEYCTQFIADGNEIVDITWSNETDQYYTSRVLLVVYNTIGALHEITKVLKTEDANIINMSLTKRKKDFFDCILDIRVSNTKHLRTIISALRTLICVNMARRLK